MTGRVVQTTHVLFAMPRKLKVVMPRFPEESLDTWLQAVKREAESSTHGWLTA